MKDRLYLVLTTASGVTAAFLARKLVSALWRGDAEPPLNPADRRISWREGLTWAAATAVGAAIARVVALRLTAAGWSKVTDETPPGVAG